MPLKHGPIEGATELVGSGSGKRFSMPLKHGPIEGQA